MAENPKVLNPHPDQKENIPVITFTRGEPFVTAQLVKLCHEARMNTFFDDMPTELFNDLHRCMVWLKKYNYKLHIHCDLNGTLIATDSTSGHDPSKLQDVINEILAKACLGQEDKFGNFLAYKLDSLQSRPEFVANRTEISYYEWLRQHFPQQMKKLACLFTQSTMYSNDSLLQPLFQAFVKQGSDVFDSFKLMHYYLKKYEQWKHFTLHSFGNDMPSFLTQLVDFGIIKNVQHVPCFVSKETKYYMLNQQEAPICHNEIAKELLKSPMSCVQEDYANWKQTGIGKAILGSGPRIIDIGFDDLPVMNPSGRPGDPDIYVHKISTVKALLDPYYYLKIICSDIMRTVLTQSL
jgi:hypothetical protein